VALRRFEFCECFLVCSSFCQIIAVCIVMYFGVLYFIYICDDYTLVDSSLYNEPYGEAILICWQQTSFLATQLIHIMAYCVDEISAVFLASNRPS